MELPPTYLRYQAMVRHQFIERNEQFLQYRLTFDRHRTVHVALPAPAFFDFQTKGRYVITREEANKYERTEATRLQDVPHEAIATASQYNPSYNFDPRASSNLGQKHKLGGVHISHQHYIHVHTLMPIVNAHTFSL